MTQTLALLLDSYRELNARRLFWIVLVVSAVVVVGFACIGIKGDAITVLWWSTPFRSNLISYLDPAILYKSMFTYFGVGFWLTWLANILALVSTAGIFPDFMAGGSVDLYLSKPISRLRLFLTKYTGGLIFVTLQVGVFAFCSFLVLGIRGHSWEPRVFLSIPLVMLVFSYLFSICVLLGVVTRSTVASLLITLLIWFAMWGVQSTETVLLRESIKTDYETASLDRRIARTEHDLEHYSSTRPTSAPSEPAKAEGLWSYVPLHLFSSDHRSRSDLQARLEQLKTERANNSTAVYTAHKISLAAVTVLPKTEGTTELLKRALLSDSTNEDEDDSTPDFSTHERFGHEDRAERKFLQEQMQKVKDQRPASWILSTSIAFETVIVALAAWLFCRRDY